MTIDAEMKKLMRKNIPIIACEYSLEQYALGLTDGIDILHNRKWYYGIKPPMRFYDSYILIASPKRERAIYEGMVKRYYQPKDDEVVKAI
jgi:hypothetical protein